MTTRGFGMGFFGRSPFDKEAHKQFKEKWSKMTDSEKLDFMNNKVESMGQDRFSVEAIDAHCEEWMRMSAEEKQAFVSKYKKAFGDRMGGMCGFFGRGFGFAGCE